MLFQTLVGYHHRSGIGRSSLTLPRRNYYSILLSISSICGAVNSSIGFQIEAYFGEERAVKNMDKNNHELDEETNKLHENRKWKDKAQMVERDV